MYAENSIHGGYVGVSVKAGETTYNVARYPLCVLVPGCYIKAESKFFLPLKNLPHHFIEVTILTFFAYIYPYKNKTACGNIDCYLECKTENYL